MVASLARSLAALQQHDVYGEELPLPCHVLFLCRILHQHQSCGMLALHTVSSG